MRKIKNIAQLKAKFDSYKITKEELRRLLQSGVLGRVTGVIGPYVVRYQGDKPIISRRPLVYNASRTRASLQVRMNFTSEIRFARALNSINILKELWKKSPVKGISAYHKMIWCNKIRKGFPATSNVITPPDHQIFYEDLCSFNGDYSLNVSEKAQFESNDKLIIIIIPYQPVQKSLSSFEIIKLEISSPSGAIVQLNEVQTEILKSYKKYLIYSAVVRLKGNSTLWSNTVCVKGRIITESQILLIPFVLAYFGTQQLKRQKAFLRKIRDS